MALITKKFLKSSEIQGGVDKRPEIKLESSLKDASSIQSCTRVSSWKGQQVGDYRQPKKHQ